MTNDAKDRALPMVRNAAYPADAVRPRTRGDCIDGPRPCPWVSCRYSLVLDVGRSGHQFEIIGDVEAMRDTCVLDVADRGGAKLEEIGDIYGLSRERIRQIEAKAQRKLQSQLDPDLVNGFTSPAEELPDAGADKTFTAAFKAQVNAAYERIVPANERGTQLLRLGKSLPAAVVASDEEEDAP